MMIAEPSDVSEIAAPVTVGRDSANARHSTLCVHSIGLRALGLAGAMFATIVVLGSQLAIVAHYSGELDATIAMLKMQPRPTQVAASQPESLQPAARHVDARYQSGLEHDAR